MARSNARSRQAPPPAPSIAWIEAPAGADPDHHLWRNGRLWWIAFTVHRGHEQERVRFSLKTADVEIARRRRDAVFRLVEGASDCRVSLRFDPRGRARRRAGGGRAPAQRSGVPS